MLLVKSVFDENNIAVKKGVYSTLVLLPILPPGDVRWLYEWKNSYLLQCKNNKSVATVPTLAVQKKPEQETTAYLLSLPASPSSSSPSPLSSSLLSQLLEIVKIIDESQFSSVFV